MIIDNSHTDIEVAGDVKEFKTSIDPRNIDFITTLLSSNLYSNPEQSFIREIVSNAWDSHVEAGTTDIPVIIRIDKTIDSDKFEIAIRDFGTGLSPERFKEVYCNIGSSTKRDSNDYIGAFGIGKYSTLACSNTSYITSYYNGTAYYYVMVKSGNTITTNLLMEKPTEEKNGVEVTVKGISNLRNYVNALKCILFFPNVYIHAGGSISYNYSYAQVLPNEINSSKVKEFNNFKASTVDISGYRILLGNVLYPANTKHLNNATVLFLSSIENSGIVLKFNIGELEVTPNREEIIYNSNTIQKIEERAKAAEKEILNLIRSHIDKDYDDIAEYYNIVVVNKSYNPITDKIESNYRPYSFSVVDNPELFNITYRGKDLLPYIKVLKVAMTMRIPGLRCAVEGDKVFTSDRVMYRSDRITMTARDKHILIINKDVKVTPMIKKYLIDRYNGYTVISSFNVEAFKKLVGNIMGSTARPKEVHDFIVEGVYDSIMKRAEHFDPDTDEDYIEFKKELRTLKKEEDKPKNVILHIWKGYFMKREFPTIEQAVDFIKSYHKGIVLADSTEDIKLLTILADARKFVLIKAKKEVVKYIRNLNLSCLVDSDWLKYKDPHLSIVKTIRMHIPSMQIMGQTVRSLISIIDDKLGKEFSNLYNVYSDYGIALSESEDLRNLIDRDIIPCDCYTEYLCTKLNKCITSYKEASDLVTEAIIHRTNDIIAAVMIKKEACRVRESAYTSYKNNNLLRILCKK